MYTTRKVAGNPTHFRETFSNAFTLKIILTLVFPFFMAGVGWILGYNRNEIYFLLILAFTQALLQLFMFFRTGFQTAQFFRLDAVFSIVDKLILLVIVFLLLAYHINLELFIFSRLASACLSVFIAYFVFIKIFGWLKPAFESKRMKEIIALSIPFAIMTSLYSLNEKIDQVMLERIGEASAAQLNAGLYAASYRWLEACQMYLWTVLPLFFAKFAVHQHEPEKLSKVVKMGQIVSALPMIFATVFVLFYAEKLFWLFDNSSIAEIKIMAGTLKILFLTALVNGFFAVYGSLLSCLGHASQLSKVIILSIILNAVLNVLFIPAYGTYAAAWATFLSVSLLSISYILMVCKNHVWGISSAILLRLAGLLLGLLSIFWILQFLGFEWYITTLVGGIALLVMSYFSGLFKYLQLNE